MRNSTFDISDVSRYVRNEFLELKSRSPTTTYVLVEGPGDVSFYSFVFSENIGFVFKNVGALIRKYKVLNRSATQRGKIYNCDVIVRAIDGLSNCYGIVDRDFYGSDSAASGDVPNVIVTDACDLETTRIWSCPDSFFDLLSSMEIADSPKGNHLSIGESALENAIQLFCIRGIAQNYRQLPLDLIMRIEDKSSNYIARKLLSSGRIFKAKDLIATQREINGDNDNKEFNLNELYDNFLADIDEELFKLHMKEGLLQDPSVGFEETDSVRRLSYWSNCRGHDYFFFVQTICPTIVTYLERVTLHRDPMMRRRASMEELFGTRIASLSAKERNKVIESFIKTSMGKRLFAIRNETKNG